MPLLQTPAPGKDHASRTCEGIAKARAMGVHWGTYGKILAKGNQERAEAFAEEMRLVLFEVCTIKGMIGPGKQINAKRIADELNARGHLSATGKPWLPTTVRRTIIRLGPGFLEQLIAIRKTKNTEELESILPPSDPLWATLGKPTAKT